MADIICVSGGMDCLTTGHVDYIAGAHAYGRVIVILNSDAWLIRKKGYCFMPFEQRKKILEFMRDVYAVVAVDDSDNTVCDALRRIKPTYFANGGDRIEGDMREVAVCNELGIKMLYGIGGGKTASSSDLVRAVCRQMS